jgi:Phage terminase large subunit
LMLVKIYDYCERFPGTTALVVRKEFTDLKDSTIKDFDNYFSVKVGSDKDYILPCGSKIMFRHAAEIEVLKNINLGISGIEQAEEFDDDKQFQFIRDRLRQNNGADVRPLIVIANANGHNWIYNLWLAGAHREAIDADTGQYHYTNGEYDCVTASTFANARNLPPDFVADCKAKEREAPNHYQQYIMNDDDITQQDDFVFTFQELEKARRLEYARHDGYGLRLTGFDIARYGNDKCAAVCIQQMATLYWKVCHVDEWEKKDLDYTIGRIVATSADIKSTGNIIDEDGMGAGPLDVINAKIKEQEDKYKGFTNPSYSYEENKSYGNPRTAAAFKLKDLILKSWISLTNEDLCQELQTLRYTFANDGRRILISKEKMRAEGIKSPNKADALLMAITLIGAVKEKQDRQYQTNKPQYVKEDNLFKLAGVR